MAAKTKTAAELLAAAEAERAAAEARAAEARALVEAEREQAQARREEALDAIARDVMTHHRAVVDALRAKGREAHEVRAAALRSLDVDTILAADVAYHASRHARGVWLDRVAWAKHRTQDPTPVPTEVRVYDATAFGKDSPVAVAIIEAAQRASDEVLDVTLADLGLSHLTEDAIEEAAHGA